MSRLHDLDLSRRMSRLTYDRRIVELQRRLLHLRLHLGGQMGTGELGPGLLVIFEGR